MNIMKLQAIGYSGKMFLPMNDKGIVRLESIRLGQMSECVSRLPIPLMIGALIVLNQMMKESIQFFSGIMSFVKRIMSTLILKHGFSTSLCTDLSKREPFTIGNDAIHHWTISGFTLVLICKHAPNTQRECYKL